MHKPQHYPSPPVVADATTLAATERALREVVNLTPDDPFAHFKFAQFLAQASRPEEAAQAFRKALELDPQFSDALRGLAAICSERRDFPEAIDLLRRAVAVRPDDVQALCDLGNALVKVKRGPEAIVFLQHALRLNPAEPRLHSNLGLAFMEAGMLEQAEAALLEALRLDPVFAGAHVNLGNCYIMMGRFEEAIACSDLAENIDPQNLNARCNRALALLSRGDFERGWQDYQTRWSRPESPHRPYTQPLWEGQPLQRRRLLIYTDEGLGDRIQFIRYAPLLHALGAHVICQTPFPLMEIFRTATGIDELVELGRELPPFDFHAPLTTLPHLFNTTLTSIPATVPYLWADPARVALWSDRIRQSAGPGKLVVGLAWQGNPHHQWDRFRSLPLMHFEPLARLPNVRLVSLQRGPGIEQIEAFNHLTSGKLIVLNDGKQDSPDDLADSAAIMANLDLVITVDSATAHLAGALARPVWTLLSTVFDWRWMAHRHDSPWYPTMRLIRQKTRGDWDDVISRLRQIPPLAL